MKDRIEYRNFEECSNPIIFLAKISDSVLLVIVPIIIETLFALFNCFIMLSRVCILLLAVFMWTGCDTSRYSYGEDDAKDSTSIDIDTLVSDVSWDENFDEEEQEPYYGDGPKNETPDYGNVREEREHSNSGIADNDTDVIKYQNYQRSGNSPQEFANALIYSAIRMVYSDNFARPRAKILKHSKEENRHTIDVQITWKDHWVSKYQIKGTLTINADGSNANFVITDKNTEAEVLELTEDNVQNELQLPAL